MSRRTDLLHATEMLEARKPDRALAEMLEVQKRFLAGHNEAEISISYYDGREQETLKKYADLAIQRVGDKGMVSDAFSQLEVRAMFWGPDAARLVGLCDECGYDYEFRAHYHPWHLIGCDFVVRVPEEQE